MLQLFSQETYLLMKVIMKCVNIKLWDILSCFHYILNAPRIYFNWLKRAIIKLIFIVKHKIQVNMTGICQTHRSLPIYSIKTKE